MIRAACLATLVVMTACATAQSRLYASNLSATGMSANDGPVKGQRPNEVRRCVQKPLNSALLESPPPSATAPYGGGAALAVGGLGILARIRRHAR